MKEEESMTKICPRSPVIVAIGDLAAFWKDSL